jgi:hypothetical protein
MFFSFPLKEDGKVDKLDELLFNTSASKIQRRSGLKSWDTENMMQAI